MPTIRMFVLLMTIFTVVTAVVVAQDHSINDGVYSEEQARRGGRVYRQTCASCHGDDLDGGDMGPGLASSSFVQGWEGAPLSELMLFTRETMPQDNPNGLSVEQYIDVLAYILQANNFPAGDSDLGGDLEQIRIENRP